MPFTGRGRADDHSNYSNRPAAAVQCSGGLFGGRTAVVPIARKLCAAQNAHSNHPSFTMFVALRWGNTGSHLGTESAGVVEIDAASNAASTDDHDSGSGQKPVDWLVTYTFDRPPASIDRECHFTRRMDRTAASSHATCSLCRSETQCRPAEPRT